MELLSLQRIKQIQINLVQTLDEYCKDNNLTYYLAYGTLLGAVRHKGYIPWDDDIDVMMPRQDYEELIKSFNEQHKGKDISIIHRKTEKNYYSPAAKLIDNCTVLKEETSCDFNIGVYIDIFPLDNLGNSISEAKTFMKKGYRLSREYIIKIMRIKKERNIIKNLFLICGKTLLSFKSVYSLADNIDKYSKKKQSGNMTKYVGVIAGMAKGEETNIFDNEWFAESTILEFENIELKAPKNYNAVLTCCYGNYMELPPEEQRIIHHSYNAWKKEI